MTGLEAYFETWLWLLAESTIKGSLIVAATFVASRALRRKSAAERHAVWALAVLCILALPVLICTMPALDSGLLPKVTSSWFGPSPGVSEPAPLALPAMVIRAATDAPWRSRLAQFLVLAWGAGFGVGLLILVLGMLRLAWVASRSKPLLTVQWMRFAAELSRTFGLTRPVRLLESDRLSMPVTWGAFRPRVLLPKNAENWPVERMRVVLSHELAHIKRQDWLMQILAEFGRAVYWFNPLVWIGCSRLRAESEGACDDAVLNSGIEPPDYAEHLLELARTLKSSERAWSVALAMARRSNLERRFIAMLNPSVNRTSVTRKVAFLTALAAVCLTLPLAALRAPAQNVSGIFSGTVYDASSGVIPNATVIASNPEANTKDMTTTNSFGAFRFVGLPAGDYVLEVLKPGFARFRMEQVSLQPGLSKQQNVTLRIGAISERVDVVASSSAKAAAQPAETAGLVRVGGKVQRTKLVKMVRPMYPIPAKAAGIEGAVLLEAVIGTDGSLTSLRVMNSQVDPDLARAAVEAVSQWLYEPTLLNGVPVEVVTDITVNFTLNQ